MVKSYINNIDIMDYFKLLMTEHVIGLPAPNFQFAEVPGANGKVDLTEALGGITYSTRNITISYMASVYNFTDQSRELFERMFHGKKVKLTFSDDLNSYWYGRLSVVDSYAKKGIHYLNINVECEPFKRLISTNEEVRFNV